MILYGDERLSVDSNSEILKETLRYIYATQRLNKTILLKLSCCNCGALDVFYVVVVVFFSVFFPLKGHGHVTVNKPVISIIYIVAHTCPLCAAQILGDWVNPLESYFQKSTNISAIVQHTSVSSVSLRSSRVHLQNNTFILRKLVKNLCDMAYQNTAKSSFRKKFVYIA